MKIINKVLTCIKDNFDVWWIWDGRRLYVPEADIEYIEMGLDPNENGYHVDNMEGALEILAKGGYIDD